MSSERGVGRDAFAEPEGSTAGRGCRTKLSTSRVSYSRHNRNISSCFRLTFRPPRWSLVSAETRELDLSSALEQLVATHEILRTTFVLAGSCTRVPQQAIRDDLAPAWQTLELACDSALEDLLRDEAAALDPEHGPALRGALVTLAHRRVRAGADRECRSFLDGASMLLMLRDLQNQSGAAAGDAEPLQYADYAAWRGEVLEDESADGDAARSWWEQDADRRAPQLLFGRPVAAGGVTDRLLLSGAERGRASAPAKVECHAGSSRRPAPTLSSPAFPPKASSRWRCCPTGAQVQRLADALAGLPRWAPSGLGSTPRPPSPSRSTRCVRRARSDAQRWQDYASAEQLFTGTRAAIGFSSYETSLEGVRRITAAAGSLALEFVALALGDNLSCELVHDPEAYDAVGCRAGRHLLLGTGLERRRRSAQPVAESALLGSEQRQAVLALSDGGVAPVPARCSSRVRVARGRDSRELGGHAVAGSASPTYSELNAAANRLCAPAAEASAMAGARRSPCASIGRSGRSRRALLGILSSAPPSSRSTSTPSSGWPISSSDGARHTGTAARSPAGVRR